MQVTSLFSKGRLVTIPIEQNDSTIGGLVPAYSTELGVMYRGLAESMDNPEFINKYKGKIDLILTSPPFPLNRKKKYGNRQGVDYINWITGFVGLFRKLLKPRGSIVIELGNAWEPGHPVMSTLALRALLSFLDRGEFKLAQQFIYYNKARLPGPAQWVNVKRIRVKDAYTYIWWMSPSAYPYANNRRILVPYKKDMLDLLKTGKYNSGRRPSEHVIGTKSFLKDNGGAIPSNVLEFANTNSSDSYLDYCERHNLERHPARMNINVATFFVKLLTTPRSLVLDPFAGSNTTGFVAEQLGRGWLSVEPEEKYIASSRGRFFSD